MMEGIKKYARILLNIIIPLVGIWLAVFWLPRLLRYFLPFVIGWILAMMANPLVRFLEKRVKIVRRHGSMIIVVAALAAVIGLLYVIIACLAREIVSFVGDLPALYESVSANLKEAFGNFQHMFLKLSPETQASLSQVGNNIGEYLNVMIQKAASPTVSAAGHVAKGIPNAMVNAVVMVLSSYFFIVERDRIVAVIVSVVPDSWVRYFGFLKCNVRKLIGGYFLAQFRIMFVVAGILAAGFLVLQVKYGLLWAVLIAILDFLPIFGTGTVLFPWAAVKLFSGEYAFAAGLILLYILTQVVRQIIQPKIVGDVMGMPPLLTLLFLYIGFRVSGIGGMILAVPVGMFILNLYEFGTFDDLIKNIKTLADEINKFRKEDKS